MQLHQQANKLAHPFVNVCQFWVIYSLSLIINTEERKAKWQSVKSVGLFNQMKDFEITMNGCLTQWINEDDDYGGCY